MGDSFGSQLQTVLESLATDPVRVLVRTRPIYDKQSSRISFAGDSQIVTQSQTSAGPSDASFTFDAVLRPEHNQSNVFNAARMGRMVDSVVLGFDSTTFCYGATGSGKTFTLHGGEQPDSSADSDGLVSRTLRLLFDRIQKLKASSASAPHGNTSESLHPEVARCLRSNYRCFLSFSQIYHERVFDLLAESLPIKSKFGDGWLFGIVPFFW